ncbi:PC4-domain-containing protein [Conidiobolus coronatus NRRL 28638]|uniref:PC4-domain-containing protein n=1 Tax=Conidiobolus coronatus (strain ATCC 28846 / CBS 209.66 / NRRL 28638) TaxID=796925 RepID=A0A137P411_CONC2|nr:PC4-domain-containing protein [Conidiobolus coronatus NRRL 28638]|eukprot:KXN69679.1 PC4-domain-containing protein [Conidiobolus coronatus NRRL 28638]
MPPKRKNSENSSDAEVDLKNVNFDNDNEETTVIDKKAKVNYSNDEEGFVIPLGKNKRVSVRQWKEMIMVDIRETYKDPAGNIRPGKKGIALQLDQWEELKKNMEAIDEELKKLKE